jgi:pyruvate,water dikinase
MSNNAALTLSLAEVTRNDLGIAGGKAANLGELVHNNFPVPKGYVVTTAAYNSFLGTSGLKDLISKSLSKVDYLDFESIEKTAKTIQQGIAERQLPAAVVIEVKKMYTQLNCKSVAVRSSATAEDLPTASFAGQYESFLNIKDAQQVTDSVKKCYASSWSARAISYRYRNSVPHDKVQVAVLVQEMVPARTAGVLFTQDPIYAKPDHILVESNFGLGESIMSGRSSPDQYVIKKEGKPDQERFQVVDKRIGRKRIAVREKKPAQGGGTEYAELSEEENMASSLTNEQILSLSKIGLAIEKHFGSPQDIEWAFDQNNKLHILQARPMTALRKPTPEDNTVWSRGYSDDYWNDNVTPLYFELLGDPLRDIVNVELNSIMGYKKMDEQLLKLYNAHVYFNLDVLKRKVENEIPGFIRNDDVLNYFPEGTGPYGKVTMKKLPFRIFNYLIANLRVSFHDPNGGMGKTAKAYEKWNEDVFSPYCKEFDEKLAELAKAGNLKGLQALADDIDRQMISHYRFVRYGIPVHNIGMNLIAQYILRRFLGEESARKYYPILISGLEHKLTETNEQIYKLASLVEESPQLKKLVLEEKSGDLYSHISGSKTPAIADFYHAFNKFLEEYGDRGFTREAYYPRWREAPQYVFDILKSIVTDSKIDVAKSKEMNSQSRTRTEKIVESRLRKQHLGFVKWFIFTKILGAARTYIAFRENQRFNLDRWITRIRGAYLDIGQVLTKKGVLNSKDDIFFLQKKEIKGLVQDKYRGEDIKKLKALVKERREEFQKYEDTIPPKFLHGSAEFNDSQKFTKGSPEFNGIPASQGIITAPVRVLDTIDSIASVRKGEILIVPRTDPGWSPVFSKIGGLITETGGILSHGAVISREYGIPAVTNVTNACKMFQTGQIITVNGDNGTITLKE